LLSPFLAAGLIFNGGTALPAASLKAKNSWFSCSLCFFKLNLLSLSGSIPRVV